MLEPGAYQGGFTITSRCTDQGKRVFDADTELLEQPGTVNQTPGDRRPVQLGLQKEFYLLRHAVGMTCSIIFYLKSLNDLIRRSMIINPLRTTTVSSLLRSSRITRRRPSEYSPLEDGCRMRLNTLPYHLRQPMDANILLP
jgi:hypothetical protein